MSNWTVKNVKTMTGREGPGFSCTLYRDGRRVATVADYGDGACIDFRWEAPWREQRQELEKEFAAFCAALPPRRPDWLDAAEVSLPVTPDSYVCGLVDDYLNEQRLRRHCKTKVLFRVESDPEGAWRTLLCSFTQKAVDQIRRKYGEEAVILNYQYGEPK